MFSKFNQEKTKYNNGQIFPFLIALICVGLILMMMTINLGLMGVYKTDVSVAADSAALAGVSILSQTLLGLGLLSDSMCGKYWVMMTAAILEFISVVLIPAGVATLIALAISEVVSYIKAFQDGMMGWSNAKKTAIQYAFQNAGIDEPRPTFKQFMNSIKHYYGWGGTSVDDLDATQVQRLYTAYINGDDPVFVEDTRMAIRSASQSGFSRFMTVAGSSRRGYWPKGSITPSTPGSAYEVISGYGWGQVRGQPLVTNSFDSGISYGSFENYTEVKVKGATLYAIEPLTFFTGLVDQIMNYIDENIDWPWYLEWLETVVKLLLKVIFIALNILLSPEALIPNGLHILGGKMKDQTDNNPLIVEVKRYKQDMNLGLWKFRYPGVQSKAMAHAFCQTGKETLDPALGSITDAVTILWHYISCIFTPNAPGCSKSFWDWFDTTKHLFETKLIYAR